MPTKKSRKKHTKKKKPPIILLIPENLGLSDEQIEHLAHALKAEAETMISTSRGEIVIATDDIDFSPES